MYLSTVCIYNEDKYFILGKYAQALKITENLLKISPNNIFAIKNKLFYAKKHKQQINRYHHRPDENLSSKITDPLYFDEIQQDLYAKMCRKELITTSKQLAPLRCRYVYDNTPFLKIAPLKLEEASLDPYIVVYHDVVYDSEIEFVKAMSMPRVY